LSKTIISILIYRDVARRDKTRFRRILSRLEKNLAMYILVLISNPKILSRLEILENKIIKSFYENMIRIHESYYFILLKHFIVNYN